MSEYDSALQRILEGKYQDAFGMLKFRQDDVDLVHLLAITQACLGVGASTEKLLHLAGYTWPGNPKTHLYRGWWRYTEEQTREAIGELQEVIRLGNRELVPTAYELLGHIFANQGRPAPTVVVWFEHAQQGYASLERRPEERRCQEAVAALQQGEKPRPFTVRDLFPASEEQGGFDDFVRRSQTR